MGGSPASFKEGLEHGNREVSPSSLRMLLKPMISPTKAVNNMEYSELGSTIEHTIVAIGSEERERQEERKAEAEVELQRTARRNNIRKKSLEEIFSATPIICRSKHHNKRVSRATRSSWENREPISCSTIRSGLQTEEWKGWAKGCIWMTARAWFFSSGGAGCCEGCSVLSILFINPPCRVLVGSVLAAVFPVAGDDFVWGGLVLLLSYTQLVDSLCLCQVGALSRGSQNEERMNLVNNRCFVQDLRWVF
ncbi:hypothetical protein Ancab_036079 [Ancistrocladus abbreviatus]